MEMADEVQRANNTLTTARRAATQLAGKANTAKSDALAEQE